MYPCRTDGLIQTISFCLFNLSKIIRRKIKQTNRALCHPSSNPSPQLGDPWVMMLMILACLSVMDLFRYLFTCGLSLIDY